MQFNAVFLTKFLATVDVIPVECKRAPREYSLILQRQIYLKFSNFQ